MDFFRALRTFPESEFVALSDVDLQTVEEYGRTLLHVAACQNQQEVAKFLIAQGIDVNAKDKKGNTALHFAASYKNLTIAQLICESGGHTNSINVYGNNPLWDAGLAGKGDYRVVNLLLKYGADPGIKNKAGRSLIDFALQSRNEELWLACGGTEGGWKEVQAR